MRSLLCALLLIAALPAGDLRAQPPAARVLSNAPSDAEWDAAHQAAVFLAGGKHVWCSVVDSSAPGVAGDTITIIVGASESRTALVRYSRAARKAVLLAPLAQSTILPDFARESVAIMGEDVARNLAQLFWARLIQEDMKAGREDAGGYVVARAVAATTTGIMREEAITARLVK